MPVYAMGLDSTAILPDNPCYIWYKGLYLKTNKAINPYTKQQNFFNTDSFLTISDGNKVDIWRIMAEFARAWAYANDLMVRTIPGCIFHPGVLSRIKDHTNGYGDIRTLQPQMKFMYDMPFVRIATIDTPEKSELVRLYTTADANPDVYFKILFFWHTIIYPGQNDAKCGEKYINETIDKLPKYMDVERIKKEIMTGKFGMVMNDDIGKYIKAKIKNSISHIVRNSGDNVSIILDDIEQLQHLNTIADLLKHIAKYKLDNDYQLNKNAPSNICRLYDPDTEFTVYNN